MRSVGDRRLRGVVRHDVLTVAHQRVHALASGQTHLNDRNDRARSQRYRRRAEVTRSGRVPRRLAGSRDGPILALRPTARAPFGLISHGSDRRMTAGDPSTTLHPRCICPFVSIRLHCRAPPAPAVMQRPGLVREAAPHVAVRSGACAKRRRGELSFDMVVRPEAQGRTPRVRVRRHRARARACLPRSRLGELGVASDCRRPGRRRPHLEDLVLAPAELADPGQEANAERRRLGTPSARSRGYGYSPRRVGRAVPSAIRKGASSSLRSGSFAASRIGPPIVSEPLFARTSSGNAPARASSRLGR